MKFIDTDIMGCFRIEVETFSDDRGHFLVPFNKDVFTHAKGYFANFIQDNESLSKKGTIRGIHFQRKEHAQSKLVRCIYGKVRDVIVDLRPKSPTFKKAIYFDLDKPNQMIFIPKGCGHGFSTLSDFAIFSYKVDRPYNKDMESGVRFDDPVFKIDWGVKFDDIIVSSKDLELPYFS